MYENEQHFFVLSTKSGPKGSGWTLWRSIFGDLGVELASFGRSWLRLNAESEGHVLLRSYFRRVPPIVSFGFGDLT